jgi:peptidoglycan/LPS O-acetylase OafA/YrhL
MTAVEPNRSYYPALDGLRGVAILLVVLYHNFGFIKQSFFGWLGVDLFFVLSGFLITDILLKTLGQANYLRNFYLRRILRIFPLYYLTLVLFLFVLPPLTSEKIEWTYYQENQGYFWIYLQNWLFIFRNPANADILNHYWSLAVEEQFYIFWPLVVLLLKKTRWLLIFISLLLLSLVLFRFLLWILEIENIAYYNLYTFTRIDGICIGCIVALLVHMNFTIIRRYTTGIVLAFALINFGFYFFNRFYDFSFPYLALVGYSTFGMMFGLLVYEAVSRETRLINYIFNIRLLKFFGRISYGLYIFHWPVYLLANAYLLVFAKDHLPTLIAQVSVSLIAVVIAVAISWFSFRYFEKYFLKLKERYT